MSELPTEDEWIPNKIYKRITTLEKSTYGPFLELAYRVEHLLYAESIAKHFSYIYLFNYYDITVK